MPTKVLLLQGPVGPFFRRLSEELSQLGHIVYKVNFNGGDRYFYTGERVLDYRGKPEDWAKNIKSLIRKLSIDRIYVYGDCRYYHTVARRVAQAAGVRFFVFEEGYLRPDYVTLEEDGVNGHTTMSFPAKNAYVALKNSPQVHNHFRHVFFFVALYAIQYYVAASIKRKEFPEYRHHRPLNVISEGGKWLLSGWRKLLNYRRSKIMEKQVKGHLKGQYYLVPLQVHIDMQVLKHSSFHSVEEFIAQTLESFKKSAPEDLSIVYKHHPMDRGYRDYTRLIKELSKKLGLQGRTYYVFDSHLPTLLRHARGTVTINSTVGLSSLHHGIPVKPLGRAIYDIPGLSFQGSLDDFWHFADGIDEDIYRTFRQHLVDTNQMNGNFYCRPDHETNPTGLSWSPFLAQQHCVYSNRPGKGVAQPVLIKNSAA